MSAGTLRTREGGVLVEVAAFRCTPPRRTALFTSRSLRRAYLRGDVLDRYVAGGDVAGPVARQLDTAVRQAEHHLAGDRTKQVVMRLDKALDRLERPQRTDRVTPAARADLTERLQGVIDTLS